MEFPKDKVLGWVVSSQRAFNDLLDMVRELVAQISIRDIGGDGIITVVITRRVSVC